MAKYTDLKFYKTVVYYIYRFFDDKIYRKLLWFQKVCITFALALDDSKPVL